MKRFDLRIALGLLLIVGGVLALAQRLGYLENVSDIFWGGIFLSAGLVFLALFAGGHWWSAFPGFVLAAIGTLILLPQSLEVFGGAIFLAGIGISFWAVYFSGRNQRWWALIPAALLTILALVTVVAQWSEDLGGALLLGGIGLGFWVVFFTNRVERWWALIPAGVLTTLAVLALAAERIGEFLSAGIFFLGLAFTFTLVALITGMRWAYWPALALGVLGTLGLASALAVAGYLIAVALIAAGGFLLYRYFPNR